MANKYTYKGTGISGTKSGEHTAPKSGVSNAKVNQTYLNKSEGHVYKCTVEGGPSKAKWKYIRTDVVKNPNVAVKSLGAPQRSSYVMKADWTIPKSLTEKTNGRRASNIVATWSIGSLKKVDTGNAAKNTSSLNLGGFTASDGKVYNRTSFYPVNKSRKLKGVSVSVVPKNAKGIGTQPVSASRAFGVPRKPKIDTWTFVSEGVDAGKISCKIKTNAGTDALERYDTYYIMKITDTQKPQGAQTWNRYSTSSQSTEITPFYDVANYQQLSYDDYVEIYVSAWARGYAGDSEHVPSTYYVSYPKAATIKDVGVSSTAQTGKCTVYINTNNTTQHPVDQVRLEYLANCEYPDASLIPGDAAWTSSDIVDNAACTALTIPVTNLIPDRGKYTWVRVKSWHAAEAVLHRYSVPWRVTQLETPAATAADDDITILDTEAGADGESVIVHLGWNKDGQDDSTGTELSWSDSEDAWRSTDDPETYEFTWSDGAVTVDNVTYHDSATITIKGLEESTVYYIKARRYLEGDEMTYSDYSNPATQLTSETPDSVVASCASYVPSDGSLAVSWTFSSDSLQTAWQIVDTNGTVIADGQSSLGATQISAERIAHFATNNSLTFTVQVSTGSGYVVSEEHTVTIVDPPVCSITSTSLVSESGVSTLKSMPMTVNVEANTPCNLLAIISAQGAVGQFPDGVRRQTANDTIYSDIIYPEWVESNDTFTATLSFPAGLDFWNLDSYTLNLTATDQTTGMQSEPISLSFRVNWTNPAVSPVLISYTATSDTEVNDEETYYEKVGDNYLEVEPEGDEDPSALGWYIQTITSFVTLTPQDYTDDDGFHHQSVEIALTPPTGSTSTDLYDIYRLTGDGSYLIGEGFPLTHTVTDEYAPFGDDLTHHYRFAIRTVEGDVAFADIEYTADGAVMRFDWQGGSLELPYNISIGDSYSKDVEIREHLNGTNDAYWRKNITRKGSLSSDVIRLDQQDEIMSARALAHYAGAVFVRTPDGSAYEADVQVSDLSTDGGPLTQIAVDATEIGLTQEFQLPIPTSEA